MAKADSILIRNTIKNITCDDDDDDDHEVAAKIMKLEVNFKNV